MFHMGIAATIAAVAVIGVGIYAAIKIVPGLISGVTLPTIPNPFQELTDFLKQQQIRGDPNTVIDFAPEELAAFDFRNLIGRPSVTGAETLFPDSGGTSIVQVDPNAPAPTGRFIFGSDFASSARLTDLFNRFKATGRDQPGGRTTRIQTLLEKRSRPKQASTVVQNLTNAQILGQRRTISRFSSGVGFRGTSRTGQPITIGASVFANAAKMLNPSRRKGRRL